MVHIERFRDPALLKMEKDVFDKLKEFSEPEPELDTGRKKRGLPADNKAVSPEEALSELRAMGVSVDPNGQ